MSIIALWINVCAHDWTAKRAIIASNVLCRNTGGSRKGRQVRFKYISFIGMVFDCMSHWYQHFLYFVTTRILYSGSSIGSLPHLLCGAKNMIHRRIYSYISIFSKVSIDLNSLGQSSKTVQFDGFNCKSQIQVVIQNPTK